MNIESHDVVVIGAGQAGLSLSHELSRAGREHVVLESGKVGQSWRSRWDSFCLVLPNSTVRLAGHNYSGPEPQKFMARDVFVDYLGAYASSFAAPVREGCSVTSLELDEDGGFLLRCSDGDIRAREVVVATGGYQRQHRPAAVEELPTSVTIIGSAAYTNSEALPPGKVLVVGSGQTGCQLTEEMLMDGREVYIACGRAAWQPRRANGRDIFEWMIGTRFLNMTTADLPSPKMRLAPNPQCSGRDGGHDLNYRTLQASGATLVGHLMGAQDGRAHFAPDLAESVAFGDARYSDIRGFVQQGAALLGVDAPDLPPPPPFVADPPESVDLADFGAVIVAAGYRPDYQRWMQVPDAFDEMGLPIQVDGSSSVVPGLHFMGVPFQRNRISATLFGVGEDAGVLAERMGQQAHV